MKLYNNRTEFAHGVTVYSPPYDVAGVFVRKSEKTWVANTHLILDFMDTSITMELKTEVVDELKHALKTVQQVVDYNIDTGFEECDEGAFFEFDKGFHDHIREFLESRARFWSDRS